MVVTAATYGYLRELREQPRRPGLWGLVAPLSALLLYRLTGQRHPTVGLAVTGLCLGVATWTYLRWAAGPRIRRPLWWGLLLAPVAVVALPLLGEAIQGRRLSGVLLVGGAIAAGVAGVYVRASGRDALAVRRLVLGILVVGLGIPLLVFAFARVAGGPASAPPSAPVPAAGPPSAVPRAAIAHRPILLFDSEEKLDVPLDVDGVLRSGVVEQCPIGRGLLARCAPVDAAHPLRSGGGDLRFETAAIEDAAGLDPRARIRSTIYAHAVADRLDPDHLDLDYWWYLPDNPAGTARGAMCGAGLIIPEITCFDHQSDWEGVTVVVDRRTDDVVAVHYAAHSLVVDVAWPELQRRWADPRLARFTRGRDVAQRPLVFIARGTHAAYPLPCADESCPGFTLADDNQHDGGRPWSPAGCAAGCVSAFPVRAGGTAPASWNAFDGHWGSAVCIARVYCARSQAPRAPGTQRRFARPWCSDRELVRGSGTPRVVRPPGCA